MGMGENESPPSSLPSSATVFSDGIMRKEEEGFGLG